ncbi:SCO family protein, partial [Lysobacter sp. 2RAB21]
AAPIAAPELAVRAGAQFARLSAQRYAIRPGHADDIAALLAELDAQSLRPRALVHAWARTLADFRGKIVLLFFGFTLCPDVCPTALTRAVQIRKLLGRDGERLQVVFITLDPDRDTPKVLQAYTQAFDPSFLGLTADAQTIDATAKAFRVVYAKVPTGSTYTIDHSALSYVYDAEGALRMALRHEQSAADCVHDIRQIL